MKKLSILGSTGSVGSQALDVVRQHPDKFKIVALSANKRIDEIIEQIKEFKPEIVSIGQEDLAEKLKQMVDIPVVSGMDGLKKLSTYKNADTIVNSLVGGIGVEPTIEAINAGKNIALANKETIVSAGRIVMDSVKKKGIDLMPIDSEHSALFQCLVGEKKKDIERIIITCSGGSFRDKSYEELKDVTVKEALNHPNWDMGCKITIDSATLMNKGFEVIEAHYLYDIPYEKIEVIVHQQSIIHSMIEYKDTSIMAQLASHDMRLPIQYSLSYPERFDLNIERLDFAKLGQLTFIEPDTKRFPCLAYAFEAGKIGGSMPVVLNAANEVAVDFFLDNKIKYLDITRTIRFMMDNHKLIENPTLDQILKVNKSIKEDTKKILNKFIENEEQEFTDQYKELITNIS